jgi:hypothetical protein
MAFSPFTTNDHRTFANIAATPTAFTLRGGLYGVTVRATWGGGSVTLQKRSGDETNYNTVMPAFTDHGFATVPLPTGTYRVLITTATAVYIEIVQIATGMV